MVNLDDDSRPEPQPAGPRREPPIIDVEAVEISPDGAPQGRRSGRTAAVFVTAIAARWRVAAAIVVLVAVIAGVAAWWALEPGASREQGTDELRGRVTQLEAERRDDASRLAANASAIATLDELSARLAKLEAAPPSAPAVAAGDEIESELASMDAALKTIGAHLDDLDRRSRDNATAIRNAGSRADALAGEVTELKKSGAAAAASVPQEQSKLDTFADRLDAIEAHLNTVSTQVDNAARADATAAVTGATQPLRAALAATVLRLAVERDTPFTPELGAARAAGLAPDALEALRPFAASGIPSAGRLVGELSALLPELRRAASPGGGGGSYLDRLQFGAEKLVRIRPVGEEAGNDPAVVIGRIESKVAHQDLDGIVAELDRLPTAARELAQPWRAKVLSRTAAIDAARSLVAQSFARLGDTPAAR